MWKALSTDKEKNYYRGRLFESDGLKVSKLIFKTDSGMDKEPIAM